MVGLLAPRRARRAAPRPPTQVGAKSWPCSSKVLRKLRECWPGANAAGRASRRRSRLEANVATVSGPGVGVGSAPCKPSARGGQRARRRSRQPSSTILTFSEGPLAATSRRCCVSGAGLGAPLLAKLCMAQYTAYTALSICRAGGVRPGISLFHSIGQSAGSRDGVEINGRPTDHETLPRPTKLCRVLAGA